MMNMAFAPFALFIIPEKDVLFYHNLKTIFLS